MTLLTSSASVLLLALGLIIDELMFHPYQGQDVIVLSKEPPAYLEKKADKYIDLCGLNSFNKKERVLNGPV